MDNKQFTAEWFKGKETSNPWTSSLRDVPDKYSHARLHEYLINSRKKTFDKDSLRAYKSLKAFKYFQDGYVQKLKTSVVKDESLVSTTENLFVCKADVMPSMAKKSYTVYVCIQVTGGNVVGGSCQCVAGKGEACSHVAAVLFALEDYVSRGLHSVPDSQTVTEKIQKWNQPTRRQIEAQPIENIDIYKPQHGVKRKTSFVHCDPRHPMDRTVDLEEQGRLHEAICQVLPKCGFARYGKPTTSTTTTQCSQIDTVNGTGLLASLPPSLDNIKNACPVYKKKLSGSKTDFDRIEKETVKQSKCSLWHRERHARLTASNFHSIINRRPTTDPSCLLKKLAGYTKVKQTIPMKFGLDSENEASNRYRNIMTEQLQEPVEMKEAGFRISEEYPFLGASADRIAFDVRRGQRLVELKNPLSTWDKTINEACPILPCLTLDENNEVTLNKRHSYHTQIQGQMGVYRIDKCDFVLCTKDDILIETVHFDPHNWKDMLQKLEQFYDLIMLPEIVYPSVKLGNEPLIL